MASKLVSGNSKFVTHSYLLDGLPQCENLRGKRGCAVHPHAQQLLWGQTLQDSKSKKGLWPDSLHKKPAWVDSQLATFDELVEVCATQPYASTSNSIWQDDSSLYGIPRRSEGDVWVKTWRKICERGQPSEAVEALGLLVQTGARVSTSLVYSVLKGCVAQNDLVLGQRVHAIAVECGYQSNTFLANNILRMYASQGTLQQAMNVFYKVATPDAFTWSAIISASAEHGKPEVAIQLYHEMRSSTVKPDGHVFAAALKACAIALDLESGKQVHADVLESGLQPNVFVGSCLVEMYSKNGRLEEARRVFDSLPTRNLVTWNSMMNGYAEYGLGHEALAIYARMEREGKVLADNITFSCLLKACSSVKALDKGEQLHLQILERGLKADIVVGNCLVDMYAKCGSLENAQKVFENLPRRDVVTWNSMIDGYTNHDLGQEALALYARMQQEGVIVANHVTFACLLKACTCIGAVQQGKQLHAQILERGLETDVVVGSCLVDMYARCGRMEDARRVFDGLPEKDVIIWNAMINGCGQTNEVEKATDCFQEMLQNGVQPDETTFVCLLVACSHGGLAGKGRRYFTAMVEDYQIVPTRQHYMCMVDLLGRAGYLDEAENMLLYMPFESDVIGWTSLLNACRSHCDIGRGWRCFESLTRLDPQHAPAYVLMGNVYADAGKWTDVDRIEDLRKLAGAGKKPAKAGIEVNNQVHTFVVGEERSDISTKMRSMNVRLKEGSHLPHTELVHKPISEKAKEHELCGHAEKLALAYGLLNTSDGTPLLVTKNLRMCGDCHSATKIMSRIEKREITVRDAHRVHRFVKGACSCGDRP